MNFSMSGWSTFKITIFAARRVLPPDLITPANASYPFMNETGPDAAPRPPRRARAARRRGPRAGRRPRRGAGRGGFRAGARAVLEEHPFGLRQIENRRHRV